MLHDGIHLVDQPAFGVGKGLLDGLPLKANVHIVLFDELGRVKDTRDIHNTVTTVGKTHVADRLSAVPDEANMSHMAVGTSTPGATALGGEADRNALASAIVHASAVLTYFATWAAGDGTGALSEAGLFNSSAQGTMLLSSSFAPINKLAADTLAITWTLTVG